MMAFCCSWGKAISGYTPNLFEFRGDGASLSKSDVEINVTRSGRELLARSLGGEGGNLATSFRLT